MRRRLTRRNRIAAAPPALPGYDTNTDPDVDEYGIDSDFGSEPHPGPYLSGPPPATPGYNKSARQIRASMERKAAKCIRIAQAMLGREASTAEIEDQALDLMDLSDRQIQASLARIAESFMMAEEFEAGQNDPFHNIRAEEEHEAMGMYGGVHEGMYEDDMLLEMMAEEDHEAGMHSGGVHEGMYEEDDLMLEMMAEEDLLEAMMEEEAMGKYAKEDSEEAAAKSMQEKEEEEAKEAKEEKKASLDPMGLNVGDEDYALAELFSDRLAKKKAEEDEDDDDDDDDDDESDDSMEASKKASLRPQNRKPSNGVRSLGTMSKAASSEVSELSSLWKNAPDVSKYFG